MNWISSEGWSLQSIYKGVVIFLFMIISYLALAVLAFMFCQGRIPLKKYIIT